MESLVPFIPGALLILACPLMMVAMGGGAWLVTRARGEKKDLSLGCMPGHGEPPRQAAVENNGDALREELNRLEAEFQALKAGR